MSRQIDFAPVRLGVAGLGRAGIFHIERVGLRDDCQVVATYDDCALARNRAHRQSLVCHASWSEFLRHDDVELVLLATPPALHAELAIAALAAGKHVLIETPMCLNLVEADAIIAASRRTGRSVCVAHMRRWDEDFRTAQSTLAAGELGQEQSIKLINWQYNPRQTNGRSPGAPRVWDGSSPAEHLAGSDAAAGHWRNSAATGGGVLWEFGIHYLDQLLQLTHAEEESVYARFVPATPDACGEDMFLAIISFSRDVLAHIEVSRAAPAPLTTGWMIAATRGSYARFTQYCPGPDGEVVDLPVACDAGQADELYGRLARHLRCDQPNPVTAEQARRPIALIEAIRKSARTGQVVAVGAAKLPGNSPGGRIRQNSGSSPVA
jgi:predicted dehydrogenase